MEREPSALRPWLESLGRRVAHLADDAEIAVEVINELPEQPVDTDVHLLERILLNLVRNAVQACPAGSTVAIRAGSEGSALTFSVADNGPGVPKELTGQLFEPYVSGRRSGPRGVGLGLSICRLAATALGGSIEFQPREPGAEFVVSVPSKPQTEQPPAVS